MDPMFLAFLLSVLVAGIIGLGACEVISVVAGLDGRRHGTVWQKHVSGVARNFTIIFFLAIAGLVSFVLWEYYFLR